jgi:cholesterol transport system auxiliary component
MKANNPLWLGVRAVAAAAAIVWVAGCGVIPKREPVAIFEPTRASPAPRADWPQAQWSLLVAKPAASAMLDSDRIAVRPQAGVITVYKAAAWTDPAPDLVQSALVHRFEDSGKILSVARPGAGVRGDYTLQTELRVFDSVYASAGRPEAQVEIYAKLVKASSGEVVAARTFRETEAASSENVGSVVDAFGVALGRATDQIVGWTLAAGKGSE